MLPGVRQAAAAASADRAYAALRSVIACSGVWGAPPVNAAPNMVFVPVMCSIKACTVHSVQGVDLLRSVAETAPTICFAVSTVLWNCSIEFMAYLLRAGDILRGGVTMARDPAPDQYRTFVLYA